jgi:hypothetical protein
MSRRSNTFRKESLRLNAAAESSEHLPELAAELDDTLPAQGA